MRFVAAYLSGENFCLRDESPNTSSPLTTDLVSPDLSSAVLPTLFSALGVSTLSYAWWMFTNKDLQHSNIFEFFFDSMIKRRYEKGGLDEARLAMAQVSNGNPNP